MQQMPVFNGGEMLETGHASSGRFFKCDAIGTMPGHSQAKLLTGSPQGLQNGKRQLRVDLDLLIATCRVSSHKIMGSLRVGQQHRPRVDRFSVRVGAVNDGTGGDKAWTRDVPLLDVSHERKMTRMPPHIPHKGHTIGEEQGKFAGIVSAIPVVDVHISQTWHKVFASSIDLLHAVGRQCMRWPQSFNIPISQHDGMVWERTLFIHGENSHMRNRQRATLAGWQRKMKCWCLQRKISSDVRCSLQKATYRCLWTEKTSGVASLRKSNAMSRMVFTRDARERISVKKTYERGYGRAKEGPESRRWCLLLQRANTIIVRLLS